jgi:hypothetical protein
VKDHLAEASAHLILLGARDLVRFAVGLVARGPGPASLPSQVESDHCPTKRQRLRPQRRLDRGKRLHLCRVHRREHLREYRMDFVSCLIDSRHRGLFCGWRFDSQPNICPDQAPTLKPLDLSDRFRLFFSESNWELHPSRFGTS